MVQLALFPGTDNGTLTPSRAAGLDRLRAFVPRAGRDYAGKRNSDLPGHPHVSRLSPWTRHRAVTEAEIAAAVLERFAPSTAEKFLQEVLWRTYFKGWLERRPGVWADYRRGLDAARNRLATESGLRRAWEQACLGETGIAPFDHWARELGETGYLHNHARMWFASIWTHTLDLPWELGADFFLRHLLDGDSASNTLSWRWVVGLHTQGKTYRARASNIAKFTGGRWDAATLGHQLAREDQVHIPDAPPHPDLGPVPEDADWDRGKRTGLLLHEDDLHPDYLFARGLAPDAAIVLIAPEDRSPLAVSPNVTAFTEALAKDAATRLRDRCGDMPVATAPEAVVAWAEAAGLEQIVTPYAPVGPGRDALDRVAAALDLPVIRPLRAWDQTAWPYATAGFFKVKSKMTRILEAIPQDLG
ncbi:FAD-binding domain-containing protein [Jannaschia seohaensis]|uniref:Deoxyribodipyrimidine photo-lyase n=1 Tax=Jannaschia seohaensis TaxID=475081 RepID=A0A2Y9AQ71_9RHOB|nr:FAD-binding domain-containing protein [Jannaschia seohaensis]PWJ20491.1 deoxyribodipyrimidine photo-lyase [Jannaschia seohaensis]SSA44587.1 deoxyribodipyrimidine photo-lyase [Jannaschia seohaensis]